MPQYTTCVRCGSILPGSNFPIDIEPPRAGKIEKALRLASVIRVVNRLTGAVVLCLAWTWRTLVALFQLQIRSVDITILGMFWKGILPGLAQWYFGRKPYDGFFFFGWLILLFLGLMTFGLTVSGYLFGLALAWHLISIIDIAYITSQRYADRCFMFITMVITAIFVLYIPTSYLWWGRIDVGTVYLTEAGPLRRGDSMIFFNSRSTRKPQLGEFVLYHSSHLAYTIPGQGDIAYQFTGDMYDRVLALEGQTVTWEGGKLTIDGEEPFCQPFIPVVGPPDTTFIVPPGHCYIVPGVAFIAPPGGMRQPLAMPREAETWQAMGLVPNGSIYGTVWAVRRSLFHFVDIKPVNIIF
jgi:hypothetical protein